MFRYDRMNALAQEKGIKKAHICRKLGKPVYYLRDVERNRSDIQGESLQIMADILGTTPEYLSGKTDEKEPPAPKNEDGFEKRAYALIQSASRLSAERQALLLVALEAVVQAVQGSSQENETAIQRPFDAQTAVATAIPANVHNNP